MYVGVLSRSQKEIEARLGDGQTIHNGPFFVTLQYIPFTSYTLGWVGKFPCRKSRQSLREVEGVVEAQATHPQAFLDMYVSVCLTHNSKQ